MNNQEIIDKLLNGEMKLYQVDREVSAKEATDIRREFLERKYSINLDNISNYTLDMERASARNIENSIGVLQLPMGIAGPLKINGDNCKREVFIPLATSEGALVASINRGASTITASGGVNAHVISDIMTRAPVIKTENATQSLQIKQWFIDNFDELKEIAESTTSHGKLLKIDPILIAGSYIYPRFVYSTGDSMGMNMVTIATEKILDKLASETNARHIALSGNACVDKKPAAINMVEGRGKSVVADILIPKDIVSKKLKTTAEAIEEVNVAKNLIGSAISGSLSYNAHYANMVAAIFLATGQDAAHVVEGSLGITTAEARDGDLYFSVNLPDLPVATVGGGTSLEVANEGLNILGVAGSGKAREFAEIVASTVLAGELSLVGALAAGHLARAHQELGRG
ncbi:MAG: hydroxymethylglutaryl-CoA reductase (NADPH) [Methanobrevibacter sp.]|uniref:3-hydroxy-3-methylglutaryl coenzyme A reductase n=1 Tax=Methanobrevibacter millerae TaxID=230361 RepID=A0A8T3VPL8_9EURY|nr:hydroxymethylglutaryl-CoA reductase (NADPH) [Methanobrevibacter sp.]MBE6510006.1 hydroxymethylglutaryl-CoA reductase (NADPH) [Methanobrevibacter millerae]MBO5152119.1 hydroxymethylglutaryl-CoA reductase (NADPH) [Methanobrevibacter sp.]